MTIGSAARRRIIQLHVTRLCNLECAHCYSDSGPAAIERLHPERLCEILRAAAEEGYGTVSFSGGEPLLYPRLSEVLREAKALDFQTRVETNGILLSRQTIKELNGLVDAFEISVDGRPENHDRMRRSPIAFEAMQRRLADVRASQIPFGITFTLTQWNLDDLPWVANFALQQGAGLLRVHPLRSSGRALEELFDSVPDQRENRLGFAVVSELQDLLRGRLRIKLDLWDRELTEWHPEPVCEEESFTLQPGAMLADLVSPLVVESDGTMVPAHYGVPRSLVMGNLAAESFADIASRWKQDGYLRFRRLCSATARRAGRDADMPFFDWYSALSEEASETLLQEGNHSD